ncbi:MAG: transketolase, partial [Deltaproteobacteria bacterium]|nr:transketolase [Deltaproteobacteria bacterium]
PQNPSWPDRDRFILSAGHASMLLYSLLHLTGYDLPLEELKQFRQWGSKCPGHPEYGHTPGVETTTGPLGQGFATGVGMAIAEKFLAQHFNSPGHTIVDHYVYAICSDGDLMEGVASEAASLAGNLRLGKLIYFYDDNRITIEGSTDLAFCENVARRFDAYGWHLQQVEDGNDTEAIGKAIETAKREDERPSLIMVRTHIAYGSPNKQDTAAAHGAPLGEEEIKLTKKNLGWPLEPTFYISDEALSHFRQAVAGGKHWEEKWQEKFAAYSESRPELAAEWRRVMSGELPEAWSNAIPAFRPDEGPMATREASGKVLNALSPHLPTLIGGSADLAPSTDTYLKGKGDITCHGFSGRNLHFGVREHAMGAILNGMALHGGVIPYGGTFLVFSDYMRPAIRLAALMGIWVVFIFTHDSIALGEDGPTHQPIEHLTGLRAIPGLVVLRPADANETAMSWRVALERRRAIALVLTRQKVPALDPERYPIGEGVTRGAYVLAEAEGGPPDMVLVASGSEVQIVLEARKRLMAKGVRARVVSMPAWELFDEQGPEYRERVLPAGVPKLAVEAGVPLGWRDYVGEKGDVVGLNRFGASAPGNVVMEKLGFNVENVVQRALALLQR